MNDSTQAPRPRLSPYAEDLQDAVIDSASQESGVSWAAIIAGAVGAAALSLILVILGTGLGLSSVSPWSAQGMSAATFGVSTILWLSFTQIAASGMGGYLAGRLRSRWVGTHTDEVYFRDTAHGFLAWALSTVVTAAILASAIGSIVSDGAQVAANGGSAAVAAAPATAATGKSDDTESGLRYFVDSLFRQDGSTATPTNPAGALLPAGQDDSGRTIAEVGRIFAEGEARGTLAAEDAKYVGQLVAQRTGFSQADAEKRVTDAFERLQAKAKDTEIAMREAADKARKASSYASLWLFVSLLIGAFCASLAATYGGRRRDLI